MARNKYPERTVALILDAAEKLFWEKGYETTSLQDIINETKLSKGAIYHHFVSKEDIFVQVCERISRKNEKLLQAVRDNKSLNGHEKLREIFRTAALADGQERMLGMMPYLVDSPRFLVMLIRDIYDDIVPYYIRPILEEGLADGSIRTEHPAQLAEALMMLCNIWMHPAFQPTSPEAVRARCRLYNEMSGVFGLHLLDDDLIEAFVHYSKCLQKAKAEERE